MVKLNECVFSCSLGVKLKRIFVQLPKHAPKSICWLYALL